MQDLIGMLDIQDGIEGGNCMPNGLDRLLPQNKHALQLRRLTLRKRLIQLSEIAPEPAYACKIERNPTGCSLRIIPNRETAPLRGCDGWLHKPDDPPGTPARHIQQINWPAAGTVIQLGAGLGETARLLHHFYKKAQLRGDRPRTLLVVEPDVHLMLEAFTREDWDPLLWDPTVWFAVGLPFDRLLDQPEIADFPLALLDDDVIIIPGTEFSSDEMRQKKELGRRLRIHGSGAKLIAEETVRRAAAIPRKPAIEKLLLLSPYHLDLQRKFIEIFRELGVRAHLVEYNDTDLALYKPWLWARYIQTMRPDGILLINYTGRSLLGHDALKAMDIPVLSWFLDNPQRHPLYQHMTDTRWDQSSGAPAASEREIVCSYDPEFLPWLKAQGFSRVETLPIGTGFNPAMARTCPPRKAAVSYLGSIMTEVHVLGQNILRVEAPHIGRQLTGIVDELERHPERPAMNWIEKLPLHGNPLGMEATVRFTEDWTTFRRRMRLLRASRHLGLDIYGNADWRLTGLVGDLAENYRGGPLDYSTDTPGLYANSSVSLNLNHAQTCRGIPARIFDVAACGGFVLSDGEEGIAEIFEPGKEIACFHDENELVDKLEYYLGHPAERRQMSERAWTRIRGEWTHHHVLTRMLELMRSA